METKKELSRSEMMRYLKTIMELELSVYTQEKILEETEEEIYEPRKKKVEKEVIRVSYPTEPVEEYVNNDHKIALGIGIVFVAIGLILSIMSTAPYLQIFLYVVGAVALALAPMGFNNEKAAKEKYRIELKRYRKEMEETKTKHEKLVAEAEKDYQKRLAEAEEEFTQQMQRYQGILPTIEQLEEQLCATEKVLEDMYALDILYPKYHDLIAVSSFYEYFATERVSKLTGSNGAYNLFEQELRMNLVINKLDDIITELEEIKENQYMLYSELVAANEKMEQISQNIIELVNSSRNVEKLAGITAYCSQVAAQNTEALKYIALIS